MTPRKLAIIIPLVIVVGACSTTASSPAGAASPSPPQARQIEISMTDTMRFEPAAFTVKRGEPITFVVKNVGVLVHELFVGTEAEQVSHAAEMAMTEMSHDHGNGVRVDPGATRSLTMTFPMAGSQLIGCHEVGHYDAGMVGTLTVIE